MLRRISSVFIPLGVVSIGIALIARQTATEALHIRSPFMHDMASLTLDNVIVRPQGEANGVIATYNAPSPAQ